MLTVETQSREASVWVVSLSGRLMIGAEGQRVETIAGQLFRAGARCVAIDLAGVTHLDSTGIGYLVAAMNHAMAAGGRMPMAAATAKTREAFRLTRLDSVFQFFDTVDAAIQASREEG